MNETMAVAPFVLSARSALSAVYFVAPVLLIADG
jgi:hypothetical protein